jgi:photosystem II stability/assembly factor-like uncharacterized protein
MNGRTAFISALMVVALAACGGGSQAPKKAARPTKKPAASAAAAQTATSSDFAIADSSWIDARTGWVLGRTGCSKPECTYIFKTADSGLTWSKVGAPKAGVEDTPAGPCDQPACVSRIRFADDQVGYAFRSGFFVTDDGGKTWAQEQAPLVLSLEITGKKAFRVVADSIGCPGPCGVRVEESEVGTQAWRPVPAPDVSKGNEVTIYAAGQQLYLAGFANPAGGAAKAHTTIAVSPDAGATWRVIDEDPCKTWAGADEDDTVALAPAAGNYLAVLCKTRGAATGGYVVASKDAGAKFGTPSAVGTDDIAVLGMTAGSAMNLAAVVGSPTGYGVMVSGDGAFSFGETLHVSGKVQGPYYSMLKFVDENTAVVAFGGSTIWSTTDGGQTWDRSELSV